jgi:hypothetical protein
MVNDSGDCKYLTIVSKKNCSPYHILEFDSSRHKELCPYKMDNAKAWSRNYAMMVSALILLAVLKG